MKRVVISLCLLLTLCVSAEAHLRSEGEMLRLAAGQLGVPMTRGLAGDVKLLQRDSQLSVYGTDDGFVVISHDDGCSPILARSYRPFSSESLPCGLRWWLKAANQALQSRQERGQGYQQMTRAEGTPVVAPFLTSTWGQEKPYNYKCPTYSNKKYSPTGCVATAMAQTMYYYKYPASAKFKGGYVLEGRKEQNKVVNSTYDWSSMKDSYDGKERMLSAEVQAVSLLMRDAGYSVNMDYSASGSGAMDYDQVLAFRDYFQYDSLALRYYNREFYIDQEWMEMVYNALDQKMPIQYAGSDEEHGGHAFVLCGYDTAGRVYVNWGWDGDGDGYYDINLLNPEKTRYSFARYQSMIFGTRPQFTPDANERVESVWVSDSVSYIVKDDNTLLLDTKYMYNMAAQAFNGTMDLVLQSKADAQETYYLNVFSTEDEDIGAVWPFYGFYVDSEDEEEDDAAFSVDGLQSLPTGIYRMHLTSKEVRDTDRQPVRVSGGVQYATLKKLTDGRLLVSDADVDDIADGIIVPTIQPAASYASRNYDLQGHRLGTNAGTLRRGIYIIGGRKVVK